MGPVPRWRVGHGTDRGTEQFAIYYSGELENHVLKKRLQVKHEAPLAERLASEATRLTEPTKWMPHGLAMRLCAKSGRCRPLTFGWSRGYSHRGSRTSSICLSSNDR